MKKTDLKDFSYLLNKMEVEETSVRNEAIKQKIVNAWSEIIGPVYLNQTEVESIFGNTLTILTTHAMYKQEVLFHKNKILNDINVILGKNNYISQLNIKIGRIKRYQAKKEKNREKVTNDETESIEAKLSAILNSQKD